VDLKIFRLPYAMFLSILCINNILTYTALKRSKNRIILRLIGNFLETVLIYKGHFNHYKWRKINMRTEEREVRMKDADGNVGEAQTYEADVCENWAEACEVFGEQGAFDIFVAGVKVKQDNVARNAFKADKSEEEVTTAAMAWRPGGVRTSKKNIATQMMLSNAVMIQADGDLLRDVTAAFLKPDFDLLISLLTPVAEGAPVG